MELLLKPCQNWGNGSVYKVLAAQVESELQNPSGKVAAHAWTPAPVKWRQDEPWDTGWPAWLNA